MFVPKKNPAARPKVSPRKTAEFLHTFIESVALSSFGCLDGVNFLFFGFGGGFNMGGHIAGAVFPLQSRIRCCNTVNAGGKLGASLASLAFINDGKAAAFVIAATLGCHEHTFLAFSYSCTNHNRLPAVLLFL